MQKQKYKNVYIDIFKLKTNNFAMPLKVSRTFAMNLKL